MMIAPHRIDVVLEALESNALGQPGSLRLLHEFSLQLAITINVQNPIAFTPRVFGQNLERQVQSFHTIHTTDECEAKSRALWPGQKACGSDVQRILKQPCVRQCDTQMLLASRPQVRR